MNMKSVMNKAGLLLLIIIVSLVLSCKKTYEIAPSDIVINELMPVNTTTVPDNYGEFNDWIELYNKSVSSADISGYFISDNHDKQAKWRLPQGTTIAGKGYLIIWADKDTTEYGLHANFKLSSSGEEVVLSRPDMQMIDRVKFPEQTRELSYSRIPNGTGAFQWKTPTFNRSNDSK